MMYTQKVLRHLQRQMLTPTQHALVIHWLDRAAQWRKMAITAKRGNNEHAMKSAIFQARYCLDIVRNYQH